MATERVFLIHHHHSDLVWRRTYEEYHQVREEQILQVLHLLRSYPEFKFCFAQTPIVEIFLTDNPHLAEEFSEYVRSGRIEMVGGLLSIPDTNIPGGESQLRNLLYGSQWVEKSFNKRPQVSWYMDAFGMSAQMPQLLAKSGFPYLMPGRTPDLEEEAGRQGCFWWEGLDGSRVLAAVGRAAVQTLEYVCNLPLTYAWEQRMRHSVRAMQQLDGDVFAMYCTEEGILREEIMAVVNEANTDGGKEIVFVNPSEFYEWLATLAQSQEFPVHRGELNPEFTGCYTTRIRIKQGNRAAEETLVAAEKMAALATLVGASYPREMFTQLWSDLTLVHFHDGMCGCHVDPVCDQLLERIEHIRSTAESLRLSATSRLAAGVTLDANSLVVFNAENWQRRETVTVESSADLEIKDQAGNAVPSQRQDGKVVFVAEVPSMGYASYETHLTTRKRSPAFIGSEAVGLEFDTQRYKVRVGEKALNVADRASVPSVFPTGPWIPQIQFREDAGDLWTEMLMGSVFSEDIGEVQLRRVLRGEVFAQITYQGSISRSPSVGELWDGFEQLRWQKDLFFYQQIDRIDLRVTIDWWGWDTKIMLTIPCEVDPLTAQATYEIPFGALARRPYYEVPQEYEATLKKMPASIFNTAKGDWPAVRWVDYSDELCGMAVANRGNPGHSILGKRISISLLRSGTLKYSAFKPSIGSYENGRRVFDFALLPHGGSWAEANTHRLGVEWNNPLLAVGENAHGGFLPPNASLIETSGGSTVICSALKQAENGDDLVIRLYETAGTPATVNLRTLAHVAGVTETDLFERGGHEVSPEAIELAPFEIKTLKLRLEEFTGVESISGRR